MSTVDKNYTTRPIAFCHEFDLNNTISDPSNYNEWFNIIRSASDKDVIKININSVGGNLFTALQLLHTLISSPATIVVSVMGTCMSAATIPLLAAEIVEIAPHTMFMFHNYSGGSVGKGGEMFDQVVHQKKWSETFFKEIYKDFLTEAELNIMLAGKDLWMDSDEMLERLEKRIKKRERDEKKAQREAQKLEEL